MVIRQAQRMSCNQAAQFLRRRLTAPFDKFARHLDLVPHVAHHHAPDLSLVQVVDAKVAFLSGASINTQKEQSDVQFNRLATFLSMFG